MKARTSSGSSRTSTASTIRPASSYFAWNAVICGNSSRHGSQYVAMKLTQTGFPWRAARSMELPSSSASASAGAFWPIRNAFPAEAPAPDAAGEPAGDAAGEPGETDGGGAEADEDPAADRAGDATGETVGRGRRVGGTVGPGIAGVG
jgi:hypothetical protein